MAKQAEPKKWRLRAKSTDGLLVTLGRYETEKQAKADFDKFEKEGVYTDLEIDELEVPEEE